jgi:hypothetical protein
MKNLWIVALIAALSLGALAFARKPVDAGQGGQCIRAGVTTLVSLDAVSAAARGQVDYSAFSLSADPESPFFGLIRAELDEGSFIPLKDVIALHRTAPQLFAWCD